MAKKGSQLTVRTATEIQGGEFVILGYAGKSYQMTLSELKKFIGIIEEGGGSVDLTQVSTDILPLADASKDIGSLEKRWKKIYSTSLTVKAQSVDEEEVNIHDGGIEGKIGQDIQWSIDGSGNAALLSLKVNGADVATMQYVNNELSKILGGASGAYDTLKEIEDILKNDTTGLAALLEEIGTKADKSTVVAINSRVTDLETADFVDIDSLRSTLEDYYTKEEVNGLLGEAGGVDLTGYVNEIAASGTGNGIASVSKDGSKLTFAKATFLTSHQSLDGYINSIGEEGSGNVVTGYRKSGKNLVLQKGLSVYSKAEVDDNFHPLTTVDTAPTISSSNLVTSGGVAKAVADLAESADGLYQRKITSTNKLAYSLISGAPTLATVATSGSYNDLTNKPTIPSAITESTVSGWGFTKNIGTITGIKMNGASKGTSGVVDLGTVVTKVYNLSFAAGTPIIGSGLTYSPTSEEKTINIPTKTSHLTNDSNFITSHQSIYSLTIKNSDESYSLTYTPNSSSLSITLGKSWVGLGNVENTKLSTWAGSTNITTLGTITRGTWKGSKITNAYLDKSTITVAGQEIPLGGEAPAENLKGPLGITALSSTVANHGTIINDLDTRFSGYLPLSGGTMTGAVTLKAEQYTGNYGMDANNSDIINVNAIFTSDLANSATEGIQFARTNGNYDSLWAADGVLYFSPNGNNPTHTGSYATNHTLIHSGNISNYALAKDSNGTVPLNGSLDIYNVDSSIIIKDGAITSSTYGTTEWSIDIDGNGVFNSLKVGTDSVALASDLSGYLPLGGGALKSSSLEVLSIKTTNSIQYPGIGFYNGDTRIGVLRLTGDKTAAIYDGSFNTAVNIITSGNIGSQTVAAANKLSTDIIIWGQSFDGSGNVSGNLSLGNNVIYGNNNTNLIDATGGGLSFGYGIRNSSGIYYWGKSHQFVIGDITKVIINSSGNVGIGATNPNTKLHVVGDAKIEGALSTVGGGLTIDTSNSDIAITHYKDTTKLWTMGNYNGCANFSDALYVQSGSTPVRVATESDLSSYLPKAGGTISGSLTFSSTTGSHIIGNANNVLQLQPGTGSAPVLPIKIAKLSSGRHTIYCDEDQAYDLGTSSYSYYYVYSRYSSASSDATKKNIIGNIPLTTAQIANAPAVSFAWKDSGEKSHGTIAQYWKEILPEFVSGEEGNYGLNYAALGVVSSIILARNIETHEEKIARLEREVDELKKELNKL